MRPVTTRVAILVALTAAAAWSAPSPKPKLEWYKGNLHTHSLWSDGDNYPDMIASWYKEHGYDFLALSDHNVLSRGDRWMHVEAANKRAKTDTIPKYLAKFGQDWVQLRGEGMDREVRLKPLDEVRAKLEKPGEFLMIEGEEVTSHCDKLPVHINATNLADVIKPRVGATVRETIQQNLRAIAKYAKDTGRPVLGHLNHPNFGWGVTAEDLAYVPEERFFEVYNGHPSVHHRGDAMHPSVERMWDIANTIRIGELKQAPILGVATDDAHKYHGKAGSTPGRGWVMVQATRLDGAEIVRSIQAGRFYASSGVTLDRIHHDPEAGTLTIEIHAEPGVEYTTRFIGTPRDYDATSHARTDDKGNELPQVTRVYSADIGKVFATVTGKRASYHLTGKELFVRAMVEANVAPANPVWAGQHQQAWTQAIVP